MADLSAEIERLQAENMALRAENSELRGVIWLFEQQVTELQQQVSDLLAKLSANSQNSSKPPSSDRPGTSPRQDRGKGGGKRGVQRGHEGTTRPLVPAEAVDEVVDCRPTCCAECGVLLMGEDPTPERRHVIDIPKPSVIVREYRLHRVECLACGAVTAGEWPDGVPESSFGAGLHVLAALLVGRFPPEQAAGGGALRDSVRPVASARRASERYPLR